MQNNHLTDEGRLLAKKGYNIGIRVVKRLNVRMAFRVIRDPNLQQQIYNYILKQIKEKAEEILQGY